MEKNKKLFVLDGKGKILFAKDVTKITGLSYSKIRHYVRVLGAETIGDILKIVEAYKKGGKNALYQRKIYDTKFGFLNIDQMYEKFLYQYELTKIGFIKRVNRCGSLNDQVWLSKSEYAKKDSQDKKKCGVCGIRRNLSLFVEVKYGDGYRPMCSLCINDRAREKYKLRKQRKPTKNKYTIKIGEIVTCFGRKYEVAEHLDHGLETSSTGMGEKAQITGFRIMPDNGQVMRNTFVPLGDKWQRISAQLPCKTINS